jgi:hypothetical protein
MFQGLNVVIFHPKYWIFDVGVRLNRYEEHNGKHQWVRKELDLGLLVLGLRFNWIFYKTPKPTVNRYGAEEP